jgi:uncharacterized protein (TIGR02001 family)
MRKSLITTAVLGALAAPAFVFAADAAPAPDLTVAYNVGLYSQYIFRGLTQTHKDPALQGGIDLTHSSGFYLGAWASNISWLTDGEQGAAIKNQATFTESKYYNSGGSLEMDLYGGYRYSFGDTGLGIDLGALQYYYPGSRNKLTDKANTTEVYGAVSYKWLQAKISGVVSDTAWGNGKLAAVGSFGCNARTCNTDARGTYYAELNGTIPVGDLIGGEAFKGVTVLAHVARQEFPDALTPVSYTDYKLGAQKAFDNGVNVGAYWTKANTSAYWTLDGQNIGDSTGTAYVQKTF